MELYYCTVVHVSNYVLCILLLGVRECAYTAWFFGVYGNLCIGAFECWCVVPGASHPPRSGSLSSRHSLAKAAS